VQAPSASFEFAPLTPDPDAVPGGQGVRLAQASDVLETARAEADGIRMAARDEGFQAGFAAGMAAADERLVPAMASLTAAAAALDEVRLSTADTVEREAVELALAIAE
jgi:flagellar biosynthesis/type III secretory pathway protein FliH